MSVDVFYVEEKQLLRGFDPIIFKISFVLLAIHAKLT